MMSNENLLTLPEVTLSKINYAFFTNENGHSDAGYLIDGQKTRNVNIYSSEQKPGEGFDPAERVLANIQMCFQELADGYEIKHKFFMTSYYANMGRSAPLIISCDNLDHLYELKTQASQNLFCKDKDKSNPNRLGFESSSLRAAIGNSDISVIRADALIFKGIPGESIAVLGASGDAHPIMMFDDENKIACYISGAHTTLKQGVLEQSFDRMIALGANPNNIRLAIGPGLGPKSYEFGENAPEYFSIPEEHIDRVLRPVLDTVGMKKYLIDIKELVSVKLIGRLSPENIYNLELDTMGFDLYDEVTEELGKTFLRRKDTIDFEAIKKEGLLQYGARRDIMFKASNLREQNSGAHNKVGRHGAGFSLKP